MRIGKSMIASSVGMGLRWLIPPLLFFTLMACSRSPQKPVIDDSFMTGKPCAAPCWYGLMPGRSSEQEVRIILSQLPFVAPKAVREKTLTSGDKLILWNCSSGTDKGCGGAKISHGTLTRIEITPEYDLTLEMAVERLGTPRWIKYTIDLTDMFGKSYCTTSIYWPQMSVISERVPGSCSLNDKRANPDERVAGIRYGVPESSALSAAMPWPGFREP